ncbi:MAG: ATP-binding cassette domain-containing protein [Gemmatimonadetes bacterium]|nr:ATP-binding cassette domain-containing protein [Gemmatimonadota bacterium]MDA1103840.1 ATP-binding cassette domain-containing protein [Gemmatimonadota bacterium]
MALDARAVTKTYGAVTALNGISLQVAQGSCVALVGESGSGKTTLLRTFNAMVAPDTGAISVAGQDVRRSNPVELRRSVGYVQQEGGLLPHWTVLQNVALVPWLRGVADADERARKALDLMELPAADFGARWPRELSGGQRQRAALARALAGGPEVLLLDEPFGALDAITRVDVRRRFSALRRTLGWTVLLVTHDLREAFELADEIAVMRSGTIEHIGPPSALLSGASTPYVRELVEKAGVS